MYCSVARVPAAIVHAAASRRDSTELVDAAHASEHKVYFDKTWHLAHYALTGDAWEGDEPLCWAVFGRDPVGGDIGYGPARVVDPRRALLIHRALAPLKIARDLPWLRRKSIERAEIYPNCWDTLGDEDIDEWLDDVRKLVRELSELYRSAAEAGDFVVSMLT
jgi:hypothetical protein